MSEMNVNAGRLKRLMDKRDVSDADVGKAVGKGRTTIYSLRMGINKTTSEKTLKDIANYLQTTLEYLSEEGEDDEGDDRVPVLLPERPRKLAEIAVKLSGLRQEELLRIASTFEKMEAEEVKQPFPPQLMNKIVDAVQQYGPHVEVEHLILALRAIQGNHAGRWMIDLGGSSGSQPGKPAEGE